MYVPPTPRACGSNVIWNDLVVCTYDVDNHTSKCTHSHWPLHLVSCQSNLPCQNNTFPTKALPPNAALAQLPIVQGKGEMTSNVLYTMLYCVNVHDIVYVYVCTGASIMSVILSACLCEIVCVQVCIYT